MTDIYARYLKPFDALQLDPGDTPIETIGAVGRAVPEGKLKVQILMVTENLLVLKVTRVKGLIDNLHKHDDHESVAP